MTPTLAQLAERLDALEKHQQEIDELVSLLKDVRAALRVFVAIGSAFKWLVGIGGAIAVSFYAIRKALQ
jgi:hypothetical protein